MTGPKQPDLFSILHTPRAAEPRAAEPRAAATPTAATPAEATPVRRQVLTVAALTQAVKSAIEPRFSRVLVQGEVSNFRGPNARGHWYFALKDEGATIDVKVWASTASRIKFALKDGLQVVADGAVEVYAPHGRYSLVAQTLEPAGVGALALAFEQLKARLTAEGLIGDKRQKPRRPLPLLPRRIGVVTSRTTAALKDFLNIVYRRHPRASVLLSESRVQGEGAALEVAAALRRLYRTDVDVIVVTRGGGSQEDLWTFNEEAVVRAIAESPVPVVSAIGHEIDVTLADWAADVRAPTPSAAAELVVPVVAELQERLVVLRGRLTRIVREQQRSRRQALLALGRALPDPRRAVSEARLSLGDLADRLEAATWDGVERARAKLSRSTERLGAQRPTAQLAARRGQLAALSQRLAVRTLATSRAERERLTELRLRLSAVSFKHRVRVEREKLASFTGRLDALSPLKVLARGYAIAFRSRDRVAVRRAADVKPGDELDVRVGDGAEIHAVVGPSRKR